MSWFRRFLNAPAPWRDSNETRERIRQSDEALEVEKLRQEVERLKKRVDQESGNRAAAEEALRSAVADRPILDVADAGPPLTDDQVNLVSEYMLKWGYESPQEQVRLRRFAVRQLRLLNAEAKAVGKEAGHE